MSRIYNSDALKDYLDRIQDAKQYRTQQVEQLIVSFKRALLSVEQKESMITEYMRQLQDAGYRRPRAKRRLVVSWENTGERGSVFMSPRGPSWFIADNQGGKPKRTSNPTAEVMRRIYTASSYPTAKQIRDSIKLLAKERETLLAYLSAAYKLVIQVQLSCSNRVSPYFDYDCAIPRNLPAHIISAVSKRREAVQQLAQDFAQALDIAQELEDAIESKMIVINSLGKKNRNLLVRWELAKNFETSVAGVLGPYWFKVYKNRNARFKQRIQKDDLINRELLRACKQGRKQKEILEAANVITVSSRIRSEVVRAFSSTKKGFNHICKKELIS